MGARFGACGRSCSDLLSGRFNNPRRIVAFNIAEGRARNVSEDAAWELLTRVQKEAKPISAESRGFVEFYVGEEETLLAENGLV
jgi:hypothetical protein